MEKYRNPDNRDWYAFVSKPIVDSDWIVNPDYFASYVVYPSSDRYWYKQLGTA